MITVETGTGNGLARFGRYWFQFDQVLEPWGSFQCEGNGLPVHLPDGAYGATVYFASSTNGWSGVVTLFASSSFAGTNCIFRMGSDGGFYVVNQGACDVPFWNFDAAQAVVEGYALGWLAFGTLAGVKKIRRGLMSGLSNSDL